MERSEPDATPRKGVNTRLRSGLRARLEAAASENGRTLGNEIERRLEASFAAQAPSAEDVRLVVREEIRAALAGETECVRARRVEALTTLAGIDADQLRDRADFGPRGSVVNTGRSPHVTKPSKSWVV